jgi:hypothetical protein
MDLSNKHVTIKSLINNAVPEPETVVVVIIYELVSAGIRKNVGEYDITLKDALYYDLQDPQLMQAVLTQLAEI